MARFMPDLDRYSSLFYCPTAVGVIPDSRPIDYRATLLYLIAMMEKIGLALFRG